jgi:hypothetical protein
VTEPLSVRAVRDWGSMRAFIDLPFRLHAGTPWVPPVKVERWAFLNRRLNAYFRHGRAQLFLARRGDRVVGRISAQVDHAFQEFHGNRWGMFGFLEVEDDQEAFDALLETAKGWLRGVGCDHVIGPMDFSMNDESGVLIEGHDLEPLIRQPWHPPYLQRLCEAHGLRKATDLLSWDLALSDREHVRPALFTAAERARERHGITIRAMTRRSLRRDLDSFAEVYNEAWSRNWGFVPYGKADLDAYALELQFVFTPGWFMVAEKDGEVAAVAITVLDINQALRKMGGRLLPFGWWHLLNRHRIADRVRVGFLGVKPEFAHTGVAASLFVEHFDVSARGTLHRGEAGWILEGNKGMNRGLEAMNGRIVKRYRVYEQELG